MVLKSVHQRTTHLLVLYASVFSILFVMLFLKPEAFSGGDMYSSRLDNLECKYFAQDLTELTERFDDCYGKYGKATVVLGDSHALNIYNAYYLVTSSNFLVGLAKGGCRPDEESQECPYKDFLEFVKSHHGRIGTIVFHQSGSYLIFDSRGNVDSSLAFKETVDEGGGTQLIFGPFGKFPCI